MCFIRKLTSFDRGDNLAIVTPIYKKTRYFNPHHMRNSSIFLLSLYSDVFIWYEHLFTYYQNVQMCIYFNILSNSIVFFSDWQLYFGIKLYTPMDLPFCPECNGVCPNFINKVCVNCDCIIR